MTSKKMSFGVVAVEWDLFFCDLEPTISMMYIYQTIILYNQIYKIVNYSKNCG